MLRETVDWYERSLTAFLEIMTPLDIKVILTDREPALASAIRAIMPAVKQIYCLWHIEKNIVTNCKSGLSTDELTSFINDWKTSIVQAETVEGLGEGIESLRQKYQHQRQFEKSMEYADRLLLDKEYYVHAWTDQYCHLGQRNTSRVEGAHRALKDTLGRSNGDLVTVITRIKGYMVLEYTEVMRRMETERVRTSISTPRLFDAVRTTQNDLLLPLIYC